MSDPRYIAKINLEKTNRRFREKFPDITSYPSFVLYDHGKAGTVNDCKDCREAGGLVKYVKEKTSIPLIVSVRNCEDLKV